MLELCPEAIVNGTGAPRTANTLLISFPGIDARSLALNLDLAGIAVSTGSACSSQRREPSHVLLAMGRTPAEAAEAIRFSLGRETSREEIHRTLETVRRLLPSLRRPGHPEAR